MTCQEFRQLLGDHVCGELVVEAQASFEQHRTGCVNCGHYLESYTHTIKISRRLPKCGPLPKHVEDKLREALKDYLEVKPGVSG